MGGSEGSTITSSEEDILNYPNAWGGGAILIHEFAHGIHLLGLNTIDPTFDERLRRAYETAIEQGLWQGTYASTNSREYWADGALAWFLDDDSGGFSFDNFGSTRQDLKAYDPGLATLLAEIYGDHPWQYTLATTRTHLPHLQGFDPQRSPIFVGFPELEAIYQQLRLPDSDGAGAWVNLPLYDPAQLPNLIRSNVPGSTFTAIVFVNLFEDDVLLYEVYPDGTEEYWTLSPHLALSVTPSVINRLWVVKDTRGKNLAAFQAQEKAGRALIPGATSQPSTSLRDVSIPDTNLRAAIEAVIGEEGVMDLLTRLNVENTGITNLTGLEHAIYLEGLYLWRNSVSDLSPLTGLTNLRELYLRSNQISDISPLTGLTNLKTLFLHSNNISDISPLTRLTALTELRLEGNPIEDISPLYALLRQNPDIKIYLEGDELLKPKTVSIPDRNLAQAVRAALDLGANDPITDWQMTGLTILNAQRRQITNLTGLASATGLVQLSLNNNQIRNIAPLRTLVKLQRLHLQGNSVRDISPLARLIALTELRLEGNPIEDLSPLYALLRQNPDIKIYLEGDELLKPLEEFSLSLSAGLNLVHIPLKVTTVNGSAQTIASVSDLYEALGGADTVISLITHDTERGFQAYFGGPGSGMVLRDETGIIVSMRTPVSVHFRGTPLESNGTSTFSINAGINLIGLPLQDAQIRRVSDLLTLANISTVILIDDNGEFKNVSQPGDPADIVITGGKAFILIAQQTVTVTLSGAAWGSAPTAPVAALPAVPKPVPAGTVLLPNYPNPFNPETWLPYHLAEDAYVTFMIYDLHGQLIRSLEIGYQPAGVYQSRSQAAYWDGRNAIGERVASGIYFYQLWVENSRSETEAGDYAATRKMIILK